LFHRRSSDVEGEEVRRRL
jgi:hypothetical protein